MAGRRSSSSRGPWPVEDEEARSPTSPAVAQEGVIPVSLSESDIDSVWPTVAPGLEPPSCPSPADALEGPAAAIVTPVVEFVFPPDPYGADTETDAARSIRSRWTSLTGIAGGLREADGGPIPRWDIIPGVTHQLNTDFGTVHPRGRTTES